MTTIPSRRRDRPRNLRRVGAVGAVVALLALAACQVPPLASPPLLAQRPAPATPAPAAVPVVKPAVAPSAPDDSADGPLPRAWATESPGVAARFPEPAVTYRTPAFEPRHPGYTTNAELAAVLRGLVRDGQARNDAPGVQLLMLGASQSGVPIEALLFTHESASATDPVLRAARPTVLLIGQQHGDEPAGSEALIVIAQELAKGSLRPLLDRINVVVLPRANPDGAAADQRLTASGIDVNRDHLLLRTPEAQAQARLVREFNPVVVVDSHEYTVIGRYLEKFNAVQRFDAMLQYATVANLPEFITKASEEWFRQPMLQGLGAVGLSAEWYYTTSTDVADRKVSMGGVQPDTGRNVNGLRNAVSILVETRGVGLGRGHLKRRVHTHVVALTSVLNSSAARAPDLLKLRRFIDNDVAAKACKGDVVVEAAATPGEYALQMLDPVTGADKTVTVSWDSALELQTRRARSRPCGYWLSADQTDAVQRLRGLGVRVQQFVNGASLRAEAYTETARETGARSDVRGTIADAGSALRLKVDVQPILMEVNGGSYYVALDQPLAHLVVAAMEPDTQNSFVANRIVSSVDAQARVMRKPRSRTTELP